MAQQLCRFGSLRLTGDRVQGFSAEDTSEDYHTYEPVTCPACNQVHHVNPATSAVLEKRSNPDVDH